MKFNKIQHPHSLPGKPCDQSCDWYVMLVFLLAPVMRITCRKCGEGCHLCASAFFTTSNFTANDLCTHLHMTSCVSSTRHISGFLSWPSYMMACSRKKEFSALPQTVCFNDNRLITDGSIMTVTMVRLAEKSPTLN